MNIDLYSTPIFSSWPKVEFKECFKVRQLKKKDNVNVKEVNESEMLKMVKSFFFLLAKSH